MTQPVTSRATVLRSFSRPDGKPAASVETDNGRTLYVLTETKLNQGDTLTVRLCAHGWEIHE